MDARELTPHRDGRTLAELIAESKRLSGQADEIRRKLDAVNEQIHQRVLELERESSEDFPELLM